MRIRFTLLFVLSVSIAFSQGQAQENPKADSLDINLRPVYDIDSNRYEVIKIGNQYWFKENLRTTYYRDTVKIPNRQDAEEWSQNKTGAYVFFDNDPKNIERYGFLYNGYAVATGKLCPEGWHIPTDKEWIELERFLGLPASELEQTGDRGNIAPKLKNPSGWNHSEFSGDNSSGLAIAPAGARKDNGEFVTLGQYGNFWTSTVYDDRYGLLYLWNHHLHYNTDAVGRIYTLATNGYSCRCVKDQKEK